MKQMMQTLWYLLFQVHWDILNRHDLSENKTAQQYKTSSNCITCVATNAVDGDINTCTKGEDIGTTSTEKSAWWYVDLGSTYNVVNIRMQFKDYGSTYTMRQRGRFAGFSLYVSNTTDRHSGYMCYKDGPELPPLDFNTNCISNGRYIIFYNERLVGINYPVGYETESVFTELCGVTVTECPSGYYGLKCTHKCVRHCREKEPCNHINGACSNGCLDGWIGVNCDKQCLPMKYGSGYRYNCTGHCRNDEKCNIITGKCDSGCTTGYKGEICDKECSPGTYGQDCLNNCSVHCVNDATCNRTTGSCDQGCQDGYIGKLCEKECSPGTYGQDCLNYCSGHCVNDDTCNITTGSCDQGCQDGYIGKLCEKASTHTDEFNDICNASFYIAGLSFLIFSIIALVSILLLFIRRYIKLVREMRTLPYTTMTTTSQQPGTDTNGGRQYQELRIAEHVYLQSLAKKLMTMINDNH